MTNAKEYYAGINKFEREAAAAYRAQATPEEIARLDFEESAEGRKASCDANRVAIQNRVTQQEVDRAAAKAAKEQRRRDRKAAKVA